MIHSFSCKNFYSFQEETKISFVVNNNTPKNNGYFQAPSGARLSKIETLIGPNASGKTNLLKSLPFLKWLIVDSFNINPSAQLPIKPFLFTEDKNKNSILSVEFEIDGDIYIYRFELNDQKISSEELRIRNLTKDRITDKTLFNREWNHKNNKYEFSGKNFQLPEEFENLLRSNASIISLAMRLNHPVSQKIGQFWEKVETNVMEAGWIRDPFLPNANINLFEVLNFYSENEEIKKQAEKMLARFDLGLDVFNIKKEKKETSITINVSVSHLYNTHRYDLPFQYASAGTKQLFILLKAVLQVLTNGGVAILDEIDANLHPDMISALVDLFISKETNPKNAQIIFSTHSHRILNELDKYQIILAEKNEKGSSEAWRLDEMTGVRADDNYYHKYIAGSYGAIPKIE